MTVVQNGTALLDTYEAAHFLGLKNPGTLSNWRVMKKGPPFVRIGSNIRYLQEDLSSWLKAQRVLLPKDSIQKKSPDTNLTEHKTSGLGDD
jgi:predicted DNA-binding transcriptional regulator AlpA